MNADVPTSDPIDELVAYFVTRPEEFAWTTDVCNHIRARRDAMSGQLFFDILLQLGGVHKPDEIYPPSSLLGLKRLLDAIASASYDSMKRDCLVYYLLKQSSDGREVQYVDEKVISPQYVSLADAYWELDNGINLDGAISKISDARIVKEYSTKIMETLELDANSATLIRKFVRTCRPPLREPSDMERYIIATAEHSIVEAWKYQRTFPTHYSGRKTLLRKLLNWTLTPKPKSPSLKQLLALPFSRYEEAVLQDFAVNPPEDLPPPSIEVVRDLVCVRLVQSCKFAAAVRFDRQYPSSAAAPRGTWGAERGRIVKEILSIMPRVERDSLENEAAALDQDARIRSSSGGSANMNKSWSSSNLAASGSTDLGTSWEDLGRRATGPRRSFGSRPRTSFPNGTSSKPLFTPGASTSSPWTKQPLSAQSTLVSQNGVASADSPLRRPSPTADATNTTESPASAARLFSQKTSTPTAENGVLNGTSKEGASNPRNAFFKPAVESRTPTPVPRETRRATAAPSPSPRRTQTASATRLPTPPQDEAEKTQESSQDEEQPASTNEQEEIDQATSADKEKEHTEANGRGDASFSIFSAAAAFATRLTPSSGEVSPNNRRKHQEEETERQRKKIRVSVPGAFTTDDDHEHDHEAELPSPTSATVEKHHTRAPTRRTPMRTMPDRRSSRKRSASPEEDETDTHQNSMPGTLVEEAEENEYPNRPNGHAGASRTQQQNGRADSEEADELGPLPTRGKTGLAASLSTSALRTPRRGTRSRANSSEPEEKLVSQSTGRPVRRSSRLQSVEVSPTAEHFNKLEKKKEKEKEKEKETRPRKSTRTTGTGATATGRGSSKRR